MKMLHPLPRHLRHAYPWSELYFQIDNFTEDLRLLAHDDAVDSLGMYPYVVNPQGRYLEQKPDQLDTPIELLEKGELYFPGTRIPVMGGLNASQLTPAARAGILAAREKRIRRRPISRGRRPAIWGG